jgi:tRNA modification GTPase
MNRDTIFALSTVFGKSGIAVIRISGPEAQKVPALLGFHGVLEHKKAHFRKIYSIDGKEILDEVIILFFQSPNSFNGEDIIEIECHGSIAIINSILEELSKISFLRVAEPGEFTKIAFLNGKIDLIKAEGLADLLESETAMQKKIAQQQFNGDLSDIYNNWRGQLISISSKIEALIDFPDDDIPPETMSHIKSEIENIIYIIQTQIKKNNHASSIINGIKVAISGIPNVGKSSLMNAIANRDLAIVSDIAGTTRDVLEVKLDLGGFSVILSDTAGIRETQDIIEKEGVKRALTAINQSDINIVLINSAEEVNLHLENLKCENRIWLLAKSDLISEEENNSIINSITDLLKRAGLKDYVHSIVTHRYDSVEKFLKVLLDIIKDNYQESVLSPITTRLRQKNCISKCLSHLEIINFEDSLEIIAHHLNLASDALGMITGKIFIEEILDEIFMNFCIGK